MPVGRRCRVGDGRRGWPVGGLGGILLASVLGSLAIAGGSGSGPTSLPYLPPAAADRCGPGWVAAWEASPQPVPPDEPLAGRTLRMIVRPQATGSEVRLRLSNRFGTAPLAVGPVSAARAGAGCDARARDRPAGLLRGPARRRRRPGQRAGQRPRTGRRRGRPPHRGEPDADERAGRRRRAPGRAADLLPLRARRLLVRRRGHGVHHADRLVAGADRRRRPGAAPGQRRWWRWATRSPTASAAGSTPTPAGPTRCPTAWPGAAARRRWRCSTPASPAMSSSPTAGRWAASRRWCGSGGRWPSCRARPTSCCTSAPTTSPQAATIGRSSTGSSGSRPSPGRPGSACSSPRSPRRTPDRAARRGPRRSGTR